MAVVLIEGFDHMTVSQVTLKGWSAAFSSMQVGRFGGQCARFSASNATRTRTLPSTYSTLFCGIAFRASSLPSGIDFLALQASGTNAVRVSVNASGQIQVRNSGGTVIATGTTVLSVNVWYYIEVKAVINGASGSVEVHLNGAAEIGSTTGNFGSTNIGVILIAGISATAGVTTDFDDIYALDTTGSAPRNTFLGDVRVDTKFANADGAHSQFTPSTGTAHWSLVDDTTPNDDTDYVSDATPGDIDTYVFDDIDGGATVFGVQVNLYARKDDAALRQVARVIRQSGSDNVGTTVTLASTYTFYSQLDNQDPTGSDWTPTKVNADEFGVKEIA